MTAFRLLLTAGLLGLPSTTVAQEAPAEWLARMSLPRWVDSAVGPLLLQGKYALALRLNPFFQTGDFDGDGRVDAAVFVRDSATGKQGILMLRRASPEALVLGGGRAFGNGSDDFTWLDIWRVEPARGRDQLYVEKSESASGAISWNGRSYRWTQLAD